MAEAPRGNGAPPHSDDQPTGDGPLPRPLKWAVGLVAFEALVVTLITLWLVFEDVVGAATSLRAALLLTGYAVIMAALLAVLARALAGRRSWARSPAIVLQLLLLPTAWVMINGGLVWLGIPIALLALVIIGLLITPSTRDAIGIH